jgi:hypothetical protein
LIAAFGTPTFGRTDVRLFADRGAAKNKLNILILNVFFFCALKSL